MKNEIQIRKKRVVIFLLITALLWNHMFPFMTYATEGNDDGVENEVETDVSGIEEGQILAVGDTIDFDFEIAQSFMIYYYDWGGTDEIINYAEITPNDDGIYQAKEYTGEHLTTESFGGWQVQSIDKVEVSGGYMICISLYALKQHSITYELNGGTNAETNPSVYIEGIGIASFDDATKTGYTFEGWYADEEFTTEITSISDTETENVTLYAKFTVNNYTIMYELNGGTNAESNPTSYTYGVGIESFEGATKTGHMFDGWYADKEFKTQITSISKIETKNITLYAKFTANNYRIMYELNGGTNAEGNLSSYTYGVGVESFENATKTGHTFDGWYADKEFTTKVTSISDTETKNVTLYAKFTANNYTITYELDGGTNAESNPTVYTYCVGVESFKSATKIGYAFEGWYADEKFTTEITSISDSQIGNITLYAKFTVNDYTITYELDGGTNAESNPTGYTYGVGVENFENATKIGHTFEGWYADKEFTTRITSISKNETKNITLYAKFTANNYTITYELDGGTNAESNPTGYTYGVGVESFENASKTGHTFEGWYADKEFTTRITSISKTETEDITLYAKFTANDYTITYELDGGINAESNPTSYTYGVGIESFGNATKTGYTFDGWYADKEFKTQITSISKTETEDITLYAKFTANNYRITYELDGGINAEGNPAGYTYGVGIESFEGATKTGHTFDGWYADKEFTTKITSISKTETDDVTLYAKFTANRSVIAESGTISLKAGTAYTLGNGKWKIEGDNTIYTGGITFYVSEDAEYKFTKQ